MQQENVIGEFRYQQYAVKLPSLHDNREQRRHRVCLLYTSPSPRDA